MPEPSTSCLTGLIGLSRAGRVCFPLPADATQSGAVTDSATGLFLDEVEGLHLRPAPNTTVGPDAWKRFAAARSQAIQVVELDLRAALSGSVPVTELAGSFGSLGDGSLLAEGVQPSLSLHTKNLPGRAYRLTSVRLLTNVVAENVPLLLDGVQVATLTTGPNPAPAALSVSIPLDGATHTLMAVLRIGVRARTGRLTCGCGSHHPDVRLASYGLRSATDLNGAYLPTTQTNGFLLNVSTACLTPDRLCYALETDDELQRYAGIALLYKTAELTVVGLSSDAQYSAYTSLDVATLDGLIGRYRAEYDTYKAWLVGATGLPRVAHPCYACAPSAMHYTKVR